jgi:hypothetical protein
MEEVANLTCAEDEKKNILEKSIESIGELAKVKYAKNTFGTARALAKRTGPLWDNMVKIFEAAADERKEGKPVMGLGHFVHMGKVDENMLIEWTTQVAAGVLTTKQFCEQCLLWKRQQRCKLSILNHIHIKMPHLEKKCETWPKLTKYFPFLRSGGAYFARMVEWFPKQEKATVDNKMLQDVHQRCAAFEEQKKGQLTRVSFFLFFLVVL